MRQTRSKRLLTLLVSLPLLAAPAIVSAEDIHAKLIGFQEVPSVNTVATGEFRATIAHDEGSIDYELTFSGLQAPVTQSHIHVAQRSVNGSIVIWLCQTMLAPAPASVAALTQTCPQSGTITGTITAANVIAGSMMPQQLTEGDLADVIRAIRGRVAYANVHTTVSPGGEIRGQIHRVHRDEDRREHDRRDHDRK
jgi:CHRD domain